VKDHISGAAADALALIVICNQFDPLFEKSTKDILMKAKLKYEPFAELMAVSLQECDIWKRLKAIEDEVTLEVGVGTMDRYRLVNERSKDLRKEQGELEVKSRHLKNAIIEAIRAEVGLDDDANPK
jgi:hypothetical protein